eukprot:CAMPEP_0194200804 /NCGR_PEP_ID=MMETSP0156-20130528/1273_1 /TAXON_ID=33649 /ORGANISM="Thalassionema nitzschioides, Strain L26-B" /LENGTH=38 /DNA_ID= /DNA_START= /DNA_END= /DNA_ORIENTATION=
MPVLLELGGLVGACKKMISFCLTVGSTVGAAVGSTVGA